MKANVSVSVEAAAVKIGIGELLYLKQLGTDNYCSNQKYANKLQLLGLAEYQDMPPCQKKIQRWKSEVERVLAESARAVKARDIKALDSISMYEARREPTAERKLMPTEAGKKLLTGQTVKVTLPNDIKGCL